jgi:hypothetical protein
MDKVQKRILFIRFSTIYQRLLVLEPLGLWCSDPFAGLWSSRGQSPSFSLYGYANAPWQLSASGSCLVCPYFALLQPRASRKCCPR